MSRLLRKRTLGLDDFAGWLGYESVLGLLGALRGELDLDELVERFNYPIPTPRNCAMSAEECATFPGPLSRDEYVRAVVAAVAEGDDRTRRALDLFHEGGADAALREIRAALDA